MSPPPLALEEAQARLLAGAAPLAPETVPSDRAAGRHLAEPLSAQRTQPAADLSAMDGFAVAGDDLAGPWAIVGESAAGRPFAGALRRGQAVAISTGARLPPGAAAILLKENARAEGTRLARADAAGPSPAHVRARGFDFAAGDTLLAAGTRLGPAQIALALAAGHGALPVRRLPALAVIDSGDELAGDPADCAEHQVPASNGAMLAAMAAPYCRAVARLGPVPDRLDALVAALAAAGSAEVIVTSGGVSVGAHDLVRPALAAWGAQLDFWRIAVRPGKPLLVARKDARTVVGLPGNPVSSYVTALLFVLPLLRALGGAAAEERLPPGFAAPAAAPLPATGDRIEFLRGHYAAGAVTPLAERDSSALRTLARANVLIRREANAAAAAAGTPTWCHWLENGRIA